MYNIPQNTWYRAPVPFEFNKLFDEFGAFVPFKEGRNWVPYINVVGTEKFVELEAELPGFDEKDVEVLLRGDVLTIKGRKSEEHVSDYYYYVHERAVGSFVRSIALPFEPDPKSMKVVFSKGVLKITWPMPVELVGKPIRLPIHH
ncbi:MAG TPA: Hsp20/alpha crystallin family protein [Rhizomicrobium sp.]|nr:Hsp20/alpha crystallin family protein [Rhizomicrobium sp.]